MDAERLSKKLETIRSLAQALADNVGELYEELSVAAAKAADDDGLTHCPKCESPNLSDVSGMDDPEFKCNDCNVISPGEITK